MRKIVKAFLYCSTALALVTGSAYAQSTVEVYKSAT